MDGATISRFSWRGVEGRSTASRLYWGFLTVMDLLVGNKNYKARIYITMLFGFYHYNKFCAELNIWILKHHKNDRCHFLVQAFLQENNISTKIDRYSCPISLLQTPLRNTPYCQWYFSSLWWTSKLRNYIVPMTSQRYVWCKYRSWDI